MKIEDAKSNFFFVLDAKNKKKQKKIKPVQKNLDWFQKFCTGLKNFVLVQKFCTGSKKNCTKDKIELQHIHVVK